MMQTFWLQEMEKIFKFFQCAENTKVGYATYMLIGEVECWWRGARGTKEVNNEELTWDAFRQKFRDKYFTKSTMDEKETQFLRLFQGN